LTIITLSSQSSDCKPDISRGHVFASSELTWCGDKLCLGRDVLVAVVRDQHHPGMWRIRVGAEVSDMVNCTRARDAARSVAVALLNGGRYFRRKGGADASFRRRGSSDHLGAETRTSERAAACSLVKGGRA
jgi:hypothetical protein